MDAIWQCWIAADPHPAGLRIDGGRDGGHGGERLGSGFAVPITARGHRGRLDSPANDRYTGARTRSASGGPHDRAGVSAPTIRNAIDNANPGLSNVLSAGDCIAGECSFVYIGLLSSPTDGLR